MYDEEDEKLREKNLRFSGWLAISSKRANPYNRREDCPKQVSGWGSGAHEKYELGVGSGERASLMEVECFIGLKCRDLNYYLAFRSGFIRQHPYTWPEIDCINWRPGIDTTPDIQKLFICLR